MYILFSKIRYEIYTWKIHAISFPVSYFFKIIIISLEIQTESLRREKVTSSDYFCQFLQRWFWGKDKTAGGLSWISIIFFVMRVPASRLSISNWEIWGLTNNDYSLKQLSGFCQVSEFRLCSEFSSRHRIYWEYLPGWSGIWFARDGMKLRF